MRKLHDQLTLQINKVNISVDRDRLKYDQNERGKIVDVTVLDNDGLKAYDLTGKSIRFFDLKQGTPPKIISDDGSTPTGGKFIRTPENDKLGKFSYQFQEYTYQRSGEAHFEFYTDKDHVDVTSHFAIDIIAEGQIALDNSSYVSSMAELIEQLKAATEHASDSIGALTTVSDKAKKAANDAIQAMKDQVAAYAKQVIDAQASWTAQSKKINDDAANQLANLKTKDQNEIATAIKSIADQRDAAISDLNKKAQDQLGSIQSDYNAWKSKTVADFNATIDSIKRSIEKNTADTDAVAKSVQSTTAQMNNLKQNFDRVDFAQYARKDEVNALMGQKITFVRCDSPQAAADASSKPASDGSIVLGIYDMNDEPSQAVIDNQKINIEWLYNHLTGLQSQVSGLSGLQSLINGKADSATVYTKIQVDQMIASAGKVKTVNHASPDESGNIQIDTGVTRFNGQTGDITFKVVHDNYDSPQAAFDASKNEDGIHIYDPDNGPTSAVVDGETITVSKNHAAIVQLQQQFGSLQGTVNGKANSNDISNLQNQIKADKTDINNLANRLTALENRKPIKATSQDDAIAKSKNSNDEYYW